MPQTALTLVNRLLRRSRVDDVSAFTSPEAVLALELVNTSIRELLAERDYPWNIRHDGQLFTSPGRTGTGLTVTAATGAFTDSSLTTVTYLTGSYVTRLVIGASGSPTDYSATAYRVANVQITLGVLTGNIDSYGFANIVAPAVASKFVVYEYILPDTVAKVTSVRFEEQPLRLVEMNPNGGFDELMPRRWDREGSPELIAVGGQAVSTYNSSTASAGTKGLRAMIYPTPDDVYALSYAYKERVSELTAVTDTLEAPDEFCDDVVERADAKVYANAWGNDPDMAKLKFGISAVSAGAKYVNSRVDPQRRHVVRPLDARTGRKDPTRYRDVGSV